MSARQRIVRVRRQYNQWVANQTLEDYALRFTAKGARRWSSFRVANTALGAISFLALEAIGGAITLSYGFSNATLAILVVGLLIFLTGVPISYYAARYGVDIDLLTRGAGFGYIGSTLTSLIYASFTFIFFAIEAAIMALALEMLFGLPPSLGYIVCALAVIPVVTHGITWISRVQMWTQPFWIVLHLMPFAFLIFSGGEIFGDWKSHTGRHGPADGGLDLIAFGLAASVIFSLVAQIGEQVDFLRFLPAAPKTRREKFGWWAGLLAAGPGWIVLGVLKMLAGSLLAVLCLRHGIAVEQAAEPTQMYLVAFGTMFDDPGVALGVTGAFVVLSQFKINVTNAYAGSIAWSNFFSRLTHSHPGRVVWLVFNVAIALLLMELGIYHALERILGLYSVIAIAWVGAIVSDLVINKPLGLSPKHIEFKRAHLYDINPVGVGSMLIATGVASIALFGLFGAEMQALAPFLALFVAFSTAPVIAWVTKGRYYIARTPRRNWRARQSIACCICEHRFEPEDMAFCPAYGGPICSLCCSLDARCHDGCKDKARIPDQILALLGTIMPARLVDRLNSRLGHYIGMQAIAAGVIGLTLWLVYYQGTLDSGGHNPALASMMWSIFFILFIITGVAAWLFVLAQESRHVAEEESGRQTTLLMQEIEAHKVTDAKLQKAKEAAENANLAKTRYVVGISHELRTPLNAIFGYAQLLDRDPAMPPHRQDAVKVIRRSAEHLTGLIEGLLDISKIEAGRLHLHRDEVQTDEFLDQIVGMFRLQAQGKGIDFIFEKAPTLPAVVFTDEKRLRQILINLLSNAIKFTRHGHVALRIRFRDPMAEFEVVDTGIGIHPDDIGRIFDPFERGRQPNAFASLGTGLGLTITKLLTEIMGGEISVSSVFGKGTLFKVRLLLSTSGKPVEERERDPVIRGYLGPVRTVLVADDEADHRELIQDSLSPVGFTVFGAADGTSCIELAAVARPDLVLLDISMPDMNGWEVAHRLRETAAAGDWRPRIVMVSANANEYRPGGDPDDPHDAFLVKPVHLRRLFETIGRVLNLSWTHEAASPAAIAGPPRFDAAALPPARHLQDLLKLGEIGYVRGIRAKLDEIDQQHPQALAFTTALRSMVRGFALDEYMDTLRRLSTGGPHDGP
ncbi:ATP-binding protein [Zavarzinia compransoris]|uniref:histidine kinase n=1 Tax=Zavarzinia compransoris TaxID=1264899 RepID=A0A317ECZ0_9PROT|nr:ATP-binding protein [Zavarzinia compransoris]PWR23085.1 hybrid sensor histidine kinase/response regulator [Zavarzinia compransoris]TDP46366.1 signal transduction histidine kinase [Zavarzinia compransoris]